ncbi:type II CAAX endopeptidase family protein [Streptococcus sp. ZJ93]|uniref:CPBP family intramembrane glutamic endopeptidase n=1 Tax=Streptococcus handemini TaxID=3161188 RepID=UPI0032ED9B72
MERNRMLQAVAIQPTKVLNWLYALFIPFFMQFILLVGSFVGAIVLGIVVGVFQTLSPTTPFQGVFDVLDPIFIQLLIFAFPSALIMLWVRFGEKRPVSGLGLYQKGAVKEVAKGLGVGILLISVVVFLQYITGSIHLTGIHVSVATVLNFLLIFPFWFIQSGTEELATRGWIFPVVSRKTNLPIGLATSSMLFALLHLGNPSVNWIALVNIDLFGLFACLYVLKTDNIWGVSAIHAAWNCFQGTVFGVNVSGITISYSLMRFEPSTAPVYLSGGEFGAEGSIIASIVLTIGCLYLAWDLYKRRAS